VGAYYYHLSSVIISLNIFLLFSLFYICRLLFLLLPLLLSIPPENKRIPPLYTTLSKMRLGVLENYFEVKEYLYVAQLFAPGAHSLSIA